MAGQVLAGLELAVSDRLALFGVYKLSFVSNEADLNGGGNLETDIWTNSLIFGLSYKVQPSFTALLQVATIR